jgi:ribulose bisphosphate carboxylase small subunit
MKIPTVAAFKGGEKVMAEYDSPEIRELQWLAYYYELRGHKKEASSIMAELNALRRQHSGEVLELFARDDEEKPA